MGGNSPLGNLPGPDPSLELMGRVFMFIVWAIVPTALIGKLLGCF